MGLGDAMDRAQSEADARAAAAAAQQEADSAKVREATALLNRLGREAATLLASRSAPMTLEAEATGSGLRLSALSKVWLIGPVAITEDGQVRHPGPQQILNPSWGAIVSSPRQREIAVEQEFARAHGCVGIMGRIGGPVQPQARQGRGEYDGFVFWAYNGVLRYGPHDLAEDRFARWIREIC